MSEPLPKGAGEGIGGVVTGIHRYIRNALGVPVGQPVRSAFHAGELNIAMDGQPEGGLELPVEMEFREGRDAADRVQIQVVVQMLVYVVQHPLHPGMVVFTRRLHRFVPRGDTN